LVVEEGAGGASSVKYIRDGTALASAGLRVNDQFFAVSDKPTPVLCSWS
jgi:hypothetical protein